MSRAYAPSTIAKRLSWLFSILILLSSIPGAGETAAAPKAAQSNEPSFSCASPSAIEAIICADPALAARDRTMAVLFAAVRTNTMGTGPSNQLAEQRKWLKDRDKGSCYGAKSLADCLADDYRYRLFDLAVSALFTAHDAAMDEIERQSPNAAQLYEGIYQYATIRDPVARAKTVGSIIAPAFEATRIHPAQDVPGIGHVPASREILLQDISSADAAASSDENFARFLYVAAGWHVPAGGPSLVIPCAALARRPGLVWVLGLRFSPQSDCKSMLPETPNLDRLAKAAEMAQPPCEGTVRLDLGAIYEQMREAIRLNISSEWDGPNKPFFDTENIDSEQRKFREKFKHDLHLSAAEMMKYYILNFGLSPKAARAQADDVVNLTVSGAFNLCE